MECYDDDLVSHVFGTPQGQHAVALSPAARQLLRLPPNPSHSSGLIHNTVEAWSSDRSGQLLRNLRHDSDAGRARPLVFGGTFPIDQPIRARQTASTFPIDEPLDTLVSGSNGDETRALTKRRTGSQKTMPEGREVVSKAPGDEGKRIKEE